MPTVNQREIFERPPRGVRKVSLPSEEGTTEKREQLKREQHDLKEGKTQKRENLKEGEKMKRPPRGMRNVSLRRFRANIEQMFRGLSPESQGQNMTFIALYVPCLLDSAC